MTEHKPHKCPYKMNCGDDRDDIYCNTHLHVKCEIYGREYQLEQLEHRLRNNEGFGYLEAEE